MYLPALPGGNRYYRNRGSSIASQETQASTGSLAHRAFWITEIQQASPPPCGGILPRFFGVCGGCQLQHMRYESRSWSGKHSIVRQVCCKRAVLTIHPVLETVACDDPWHYRNHMRFSVNRDGQPGLTAQGHTIALLPLIRCPIRAQADQIVSSAS